MMNKSLIIHKHIFPCNIKSQNDTEIEKVSMLTWYKNFAVITTFLNFYNFSIIEHIYA